MFDEDATMHVVDNENTDIERNIHVRLRELYTRSNVHVINKKIVRTNNNIP